jgi:hypothetical protein
MSHLCQVTCAALHRKIEIGTNKGGIFFCFALKLTETQQDIIFCILFGFEMEQRTIKHSPYSDEEVKRHMGR